MYAVEPIVMNSLFANEGGYIHVIKYKRNSGPEYYLPIFACICGLVMYRIKKRLP